MKDITVEELLTIAQEVFPHVSNWKYRSQEDPTTGEWVASQVYDEDTCLLRFTIINEPPILQLSNEDPCPGYESFPLKDFKAETIKEGLETLKPTLIK